MSNNEAPIRGSVAKLVTSDELVINRGRSQGISVGMVFEVLDPATENVIDPETGEDLGSIRRVKAKVRVYKVEAKLSLARRVRSGIGAIARLFEPMETVAGSTGPRPTAGAVESSWG